MEMNNMSSKKSTKNNRRTIIIASSAVLLVAAITFFTILIVSSVSANKAASGFIEVCEKGDTGAMEEYVPNYSAELPDEVKELMQSALALDEEETTDNEDENQQDIDLDALILKHSTFSKSTIFTLGSKASVKISISGPDMKKILDLATKKFLTDDSDAASNLSSESLYSEIEALIESEKYTYKHEVKIPMLKINGKWYVDYQSVDVMDELLGGYQTAYSELYQRAFEELMEYYGMTEGDETSNEN